jgi:hypothetical protein
MAPHVELHPRSISARIVDVAAERRASCFPSAATNKDWSISSSHQIYLQESRRFLPRISDALDADSVPF